MNNTTEVLKLIGSCAGFLAFIWNMIVYFGSRRGGLEVTIGWGTEKGNLSTYLYIDVVNKGVDTRVIDYVSIVYLDQKPLKNGRHSTDEYIVNLPGLSLKRGEKGREKIRYQENTYLMDLFLNRKILFRVTDTLGKNYDSTKLK
ncbi:hypothetical protein [Pedobacter cryoconitis]|uniref:Uncharacterized protein n=1 Tax=Pedobacter cryoconitis TaxID=188932 RepID=A0A7X0JAW2_9SPHI|nr:hypothetical protein [Pedobacter cryoconitis]MBB6503021.1 hypothetical protein [Pedobacter cryoconitis]